MPLAIGFECYIGLKIKRFQPRFFFQPSQEAVLVISWSARSWWARVPLPQRWCRGPRTAAWNCWPIRKWTTTSCSRTRISPNNTEVLRTRRKVRRLAATRSGKARRPGGLFHPMETQVSWRFNFFTGPPKCFTSLLMSKHLRKINWSFCCNSEKMVCTPFVINLSGQAETRRQWKTVTNVCTQKNRNALVCQMNLQRRIFDF